MKTNLNVQRMMQSIFHVVDHFASRYTLIKTFHNNGRDGRMDISSHHMKWSRNEIQSCSQVRNPYSVLLLHMCVVLAIGNSVVSINSSWASKTTLCPYPCPKPSHLNMVRDYNLSAGTNHEGREPLPKSYKWAARSILIIFRALILFVLGVSNGQ